MRRPKEQKIRDIKIGRKDRQNLAGRLWVLYNNEARYQTDTTGGSRRSCNGWQGICTSGPDHDHSFGYRCKGFRTVGWTKE